MWAKKLLKNHPKKNKYNARKVALAGYSFDSMAEADTFLMLKEKEKLGQLKVTGVQVSIYLTEAMVHYKADFQCESPTGELFYVEHKGFKTPSWRIKLRLYRVYGPAPLEIYEKMGRRLILVETVVPKPPKIKNAS